MSSTFKVGEIIADYEITGVLGTGGMGAVYQVRHLISEREEAMKVLLPDLEGSPQLAERFVREVRLLGSLSHPGIAMLHTALRHRNQLLMVMESVRGETLEVLLRRKGFDLASGVDLIIQVLNALAYAHGRNVVHRDVKPANIMLTHHGQAKLLDFGIARPLADIQLTEKGATLGSFHYMSPEQIRGLPVDNRTDLYSTGITLYEIATGTRPFSGADSYAVMKAQVEQIPAPPESINPGVPQELSRALSRALMKEAPQRFQTAEEFAAVLQPIREQLGFIAPMPGRGRMQPTPTPLASTAALSAVVIFEPATLERVTEKLASSIGPVAKVLVKRAAKKATSWKQLYEMLAVELPEQERKAFLSSRQFS